MAIKNYIKYFFTCRKCSDNFMEETKDINQLNLANKYEAIAYLWKSKMKFFFSSYFSILYLLVHNHVNQRLRNDVTEDPDHPKVQFPSKYLCATCRVKNKNNHTEYDMSKTIDFLIVYYSKENIEKSSISKSLNRSESVTQKLEYILDKTVHIGFLKTIFQRYTPYIFIGLIILIILCRRRYCKTKRKRYTV